MQGDACQSQRQCKSKAACGALTQLGRCLTVFAFISLIAQVYSEQFNVSISEPVWVVKRDLSDNLPPQVHLQDSNNCVGLFMFEKRLFIGWRTAATHFASDSTMHYIMSSENMGNTWDFEHSIFMESDMREPHFYEFNGTLFYTFFQAGTNPLGFDPQNLLRIQRIGLGQWTQPQVWGMHGEIAWQMRTINGVVYTTSYVGDHYDPKQSNINVYFNYSHDGITFKPLNSSNPVMYRGGVSEVGWTLDSSGNFWAVMRNEDGDSSGFGSRIVFAPADDLSNWQLFPAAASDPWIYESPRMFTHGDDVYLIARRDIHGPFDRGYHWLPFVIQKERNLVEYSLRSHTTALWRIDKATRTPVWIADLPGDGDTAFPSILQLSDDEFLVANYSSPLNHPDWSWLEGQISSEGTGIYFVTVRFSPMYL